MDTLTVYKEQLKSDIHWMSVFRKAIEQGKAESSSPWNDTAEQKEGLRELEAMLGHACQILPTLKRSWESTWSLLTAGVVGDYDEIRQDLQQTFETGIGLLREVHTVLESFVKAGYPLTGVDRLPPIVGELESLRNSIFLHWPTFSETDIEEARTGSGNLPLDEAFANIANTDVTTWNDRVSKHLQAKQGLR